MCIRSKKRISYYIGATNNWDKRWAAHCSGKGAKYTKSHPPFGGIVVELVENRSVAQKLEAKLKRLSASEKQELMAIKMAFDPDPGEPWNGVSYFRKLPNLLK